MRNATFDIVKFALAIMIVGLHSFVFFEISQTTSFLLYNGLFRVATPLFFVLSGYFLPHPCNLLTAGKWFLRVLMMYIFWMIFYMPDYMHFDRSAFSIVYDLVKNFILGYWHLWYIGAILVAGPITLFLRNVHIKYAACVIALSYLTGCIIQFISYYEVSDSLPQHIQLYRNALFFGLPFMIIGDRYQDFRPYLEQHYKKLLAIGSLALLSEVLLSLNFAGGKEGYDLYFSLIILCPAIFAGVTQLGKITTNFPYGKLSAALYFLHPFFLNRGHDYGLADGTTLFGFALALSFIFSIPFIILSKKIRFIL